MRRLSDLLTLADSANLWQPPQAGMAKTRSTSITIPPDLRQWLESQTRYGFGIGAVIREHLLRAMAASDAKR